MPPPFSEPANQASNRLPDQPMYPQVMAASAANAAQQAQEALLQQLLSSGGSDAVAALMGALMPKSEGSGGSYGVDPSTGACGRLARARPHLFFCVHGHAYARGCMWDA
eukprot:364662-Chlamydomonas_euryale.AAC.9